MGRQKGSNTERINNIQQPTPASGGAQKQQSYEKFNFYG